MLLSRFSTPERPGQDSIALRRLAEGLVLLATLVVFSGTVDFGFVYDDHVQIVLNPFLRTWHFVGRYFTRDVWSQSGRGQGSSYYRPLFLLWLRLNYWLFHLKPTGWHVTAVLLHVGVTWLVYRLAARLLRDAWKAAWVAALFGLNPIHLEAVAWVSGVTDPLTAIFLLSAFLAYLQFRQGLAGKWRWAVGSWLLFALGLLTKETAVTFPLIVAAYDGLLGSSSPATEQPRRLEPTQSPLARSRAKTWWTRWRSAFFAAAPYLLLSLAYLLLRVWIFGSITGPTRPRPWRLTLFTLPTVLWSYLRLLIWPSPLSIYYDMPWIHHPSFRQFWLPLLGLALVAIALAWWSWRRPVVGWAGLWILVFLAPVLDLALLPSDNLVQDRYLYLPSLGFSMLLVELLASLFPRRSNPARLSRVASGVATLILMAYATTTLAQSTYWANDTLLYYHAVQVAPDSPNAKTALGTAMMADKHYRKAINLFRAAIAEAPDFSYPWDDLAYLYYQTGDYRQAVACAEQFLRLSPDMPDGYYLLGISEYQLGHARRAAEVLGYAASLKPHAYGFHYALGLALLKEGHRRRALLEFEAEPRQSTQWAAAQKQIALLTRTSSGSLRPAP